MAFTAQSNYQSASYQHQKGVPPNTDYKRSSELFSDYVARMAASALLPDIGPTESDAAYVTRLASYNVLAPSITAATASYVAGSNVVGTVVSASYATTSSYVNV